MYFDPPLLQGTLIRRYKRFLADIETATGEQLTIHCANTGSMKNCLVSDSPLWYSDSGNWKRKYRHTWEIATTADGQLAGINTSRANALVEEAIIAGHLPSCGPYDQLLREVKYGENSRADFCLVHKGLHTYIEVKNVTLAESGQGYFPDAVSVRAHKHLDELTQIAQTGGRAILVFCVQHSGITSVAPACHIDPVYGKKLKRAAEAGVAIYALRGPLSAKEITLNQTIPVLID